MRKVTRKLRKKKLGKGNRKGKKMEIDPTRRSSRRRSKPDIFTIDKKPHKTKPRTYGRPGSAPSRLNDPARAKIVITDFVEEGRSRLFATYYSKIKTIKSEVDFDNLKKELMEINDGIQTEKNVKLKQISLKLIREQQQIIKDSNVARRDTNRLISKVDNLLTEYEKRMNKEPNPEDGELASAFQMLYN